MKWLIIITLFLSGFFWSCSEDNLATYTEGDSVYFAVQKKRAAYKESLPYVDSTVFSFINFRVMDTTLYLRVNTLGNVVPYERKFKVEVVKPETTAVSGTHYDDPTGEYVVPKDSVYGIVPVTLHRTIDMRENIYSLKIRLQPTADFQLALEKVVVDKVNEEYTDLLQHTIRVSDLVIKPSTWDFSMDGFGKAPEMGNWSVDKFLLTNYVMGIEPGKWEDENYMNIGRIQAVSVFMRNYLMDMIKKGTAVKDDVEPDGFMRVKGVIVPQPYTGSFVSVTDLMK